MTAQAGDTTSLSSRKAAQRKALRRARAVVPLATRRRAARSAARHLARLARTAGARHVAAYLSLAEEIDTAPLIARLRRQGCRVYVPKLAGARLRFAPLRGVLRANRFRIAEPVGAGRPPRLDLIVLPLVAFDADGRRLGMGGGYYDRLLARQRPARRPLRVGLAFAAQEVPAVPAGAGDARLDAVVTERGARRFR
jgi:5-formyltetrahydrofolate cyclo-ligase